MLHDAAISEGHGDTAMALLKAGAETNKRDENDKLAIELAPDSKVSSVDLGCQRDPFYYLSLLHVAFPLPATNSLGAPDVIL